MLIDIVAPIATYYVLRAFGVGQFLALILSAIPTTLNLLFQIVRKRHLDGMAVFVLVIIGLSLAASFITGSPRFLLAKDGIFTAAIGIAFYASLFTRYPLSFVLGRAMAERTGMKSRSWVELWQRVPRFRRPWRRSSVIWGTGMMIDAALRIAMAYTLSVDSVPALNGALAVVSLVLLQLIDQVQLRRSGAFAMLFAPEGDDLGVSAMLR